MLSWRGKLLLLGTVYLGGFATAVYCLAPPANVSREVLAARQASLATTPSDRLLAAIRVAARKAKEAGQDLVDRTTVLIESRTRPESSPNATATNKS